MNRRKRSAYSFNPIVGQEIPSSKKSASRKLRKEMTSAEKLLWHQLRNNKLGNIHFRRQQIIRGVIVDFYCHKTRLVIEIDGESHNVHPEKDVIRDRNLQNLGLKVIRFKNEDVLSNLGGVLKRILAVSDREAT